MEQTAIQELIVILKKVIENDMISDSFKAGIKLALWEARTLRIKERLQLEKATNNTIT
jgi:tmRNA-binding protein